MARDKRHFEPELSAVEDFERKQDFIVKELSDLTIVKITYKGKAYSRWVRNKNGRSQEYDDMGVKAADSFIKSKIKRAKYDIILEIRRDELY